MYFSTCWSSDVLENFFRKQSEIFGVEDFANIPTVQILNEYSFSAVRRFRKQN